MIALGLAFWVGWLLGQRASERRRLPSVRFNITIPADTPPADQLYLTGSFNDWNPADARYLLTRSADLATGSWAFPHGQLIEYKLTRGSWASVEKGPGHSEIPNYSVTVTPQLVVERKVATWSDQAYDENFVYDQRVERIEITSAALGVKRTLYVYLPAEVKNNPSLRVPSIYLLRGHEREWINKNEDSSRAGKHNVIDVYEELRSQGTVGPLVLVFPGMTSANGATHSLGINMRAPELAADATLGSGRFEDYLLNDVIPYVEAHYPVLPGGQHRAIDGFSLGGFMSVTLALRNTQAFQSVGSYDGLFFWDDPERQTHIDGTDTVFTRALFDANFGLPRDQVFAAEHNPPNLLRQNGHHAADLQWLVEFGPEHAEPNVNYFRGVRLIELLHEHGIVNELGGPLPDGAHTWKMADDHMRRALPLHWERIRA